MPHVDEGQIHAYLDKAMAYTNESARTTFEQHMKTCAECTALLKEETTIRQGSDSLLSLAGNVDVVAPPFNTIRPPEKQAVKRFSSVSTMTSLAWAASIVIGLVLASTAWWLYDRRRG